MFTEPVILQAVSGNVVEPHEAAFSAELPDTESRRSTQHLQPQRLGGTVGANSHARDATAWDTLASVSLTQQYGSVAAPNSQTSWSSSTHQRTLHVSYTCSFVSFLGMGTLMYSVQKL